MQLLITHGMSRTHALRVERWQIGLALVGLLALLTVLSGTVYHFVFLKGVREGWPVVSPVVGLIVRDEIAQRDRFMRENLDAMAQKVGEMQARLVQLQATSERLAALAGLKAEDRPPGPATAPGLPAQSTIGRGGPYLPLDSPSLVQLQGSLAKLDEAADFSSDLFVLAESRLQESRLRRLMIPSAPPVDGEVGSGFGFRSDPITHRTALHTGLDFAAETGTPIHAAAGGIVADRSWHAEYGQVLEIDHGRGLATRYAHCSAIVVEPGSIVKRGQVVARVGTSGRSTGAHLHFEVLVDGSPQDPARFLAQGGMTAAMADKTRAPAR